MDACFLASFDIHSKAMLNDGVLGTQDEIHVPQICQGQLQKKGSLDDDDRYRRTEASAQRAQAE